MPSREIVKTAGALLACAMGVAACGSVHHGHHAVLSGTVSQCITAWNEAVKGYGEVPRGKNLSAYAIADLIKSANDRGYIAVNHERGIGDLLIPEGACVIFLAGAPGGMVIAESTAEGVGAPLSWLILNAPITAHWFTEAQTDATNSPNVVFDSNNFILTPKVY